MQILRRHLARTIGRSIAVAVCVLFALFVFFTLLEELEDADGGIGYALTRTALFMPSIAYEVLPMCTLIGVLVGLGTLAQNRELVVLRASGLSRAVLARLVAQIALVVIFAGMLAGEFLAPGALSRATAMQESAERTTDTKVSQQAKWIHDGDRFVRIGRAINARELADITEYAFDDTGRMVRALSAERARYENGMWLLEGVRETTLRDEGLPTTLASRASLAPQTPWALSLRPAVVSLVALPPERLSMLSLVRLLVEMRNTGQSSDVYLQSFWRRLVYPAAGLAMVMLAIPMTLSPRPRSSGGRQVITGLLIGLGFYLANKLCASLGTVYGLHPVAAALAPTLLLGAAAWHVNRRAV